MYILTKNIFYIFFVLCYSLLITITNNITNISKNYYYNIYILILIKYDL